MEDATAQNPEQKKEKPLHELLTSSLVDVYVGASSTHWTLHEQLLCHYSPFFATKLHADDKEEERKQRGNKSYSLPDEDDEPFELLVAWLYSQSIRPPKVENDIGPLLELYLLAVKLEVEKLQSDVVETVRDYYHSTSTYPGLRRVQYIYSETDEDNEMREMMVSAVARQLTTSDKIAAHWATALQRNGQLAVDIIRAIQQWHIEERSIPDARDVSSHRGRRASEFGFSSIERVGNSTDTVDTNMGVESVNSGASDAPNIKSDAEE
ncbi:hypothetical protein PV08_08851 [Exophiala spinifera]|uniref:BTB domain-containing protein n=1 Tax=Exophiala spinifera TaxID=91928 RepID=A0A0D2B4N7_9EURO|nr:uncharacterized protein PV08_08851 [Exophiala spinifera]KIW13660.1 hypothetical protein PV08_08851 [Exophiala spinifera]